ncbi:MAG: sulfatase [Akkermansiaceae bacterium]
MKYRRLHTAFLAIITGILSSSSLLAKKHPNVLFIIFDDLNTRVSTSGYPNMITPNFDRLAAEGMTFNRAYCQYPVCGPSRASLLSGLYPQSSGVINNFTDIRNTRPRAKSLPQTFKEQGYWTGSVGKIFHNSKTNHEGVAWDEFHYFENEELPMVTAVREKWEKENGPIDRSGENRKAWREFLLQFAPQTMNQKPGWGPTGLRDEEHKDGKNARQVVSWLDQESYGDKPFFMAVGIHKPHGPFIAPKKYFDLYPTKDLEIMPASLKYWETVDKIAQTGRHKGFDFEFGVENEALRREYTQAYHACISYVDAQIGLVFDALKKSGEWDRTIIVMTSDHGYLLGQKFMWGKVFLWDSCAKVPFIVRVPGITKAGSSSESIIELLDIFPTLTDLAGIDAPEYLQGKSIRPILENPQVETKSYAYTVVQRRNQVGRAISGKRFNYIAWPNGAEELYDLTEDSKELVNLAKSSEHTKQLEEMRVYLVKVEAKAEEHSTNATKAALEKSMGR